MIVVLPGIGVLYPRPSVGRLPYSEAGDTRTELRNLAGKLAAPRRGQGNGPV